ncbi:MAG TPA: endosialidase [Lachnospiraceae bacterium]|nr:endosialidase [Lachnospiraceae bacterium]
MANVKELIRIEADGTLSFGDFELEKKTKLEDFEYEGNLYKVKTFKELTKLERDGLFVYESDPGTAVNSLKVTGDGMEFKVSGKEDAQITVGLSEDTEYDVFISGKSIGRMKTNLGGKLSFSVEFTGNEEVPVRISL